MATLSRSARRSRRTTVLILSVVTALAVLPVLPAFAVDVTVNCPADSLQAAIDAAAPGDSITVNGVCDENITVDKDLNLAGGVLGGTIDGGNSGSVVTIAAGVEVAVDGLIIRNGHGDIGGGILNFGDLNIQNSRVEDNSLSEDFSSFQAAGAGIHNAAGATLWLHEVWVTGNETFHGAGGVSNSGEAVLEDCWILDNESNFDAGGISNGGMMEITGCRIADNFAEGATFGDGPGGVGNGGTMTITSSVIEGNATNEGSGGGISNHFGTLTVEWSTIARNSAMDGAGVFQLAGETMIRHSVIEDNEWTPAPGNLVQGNGVWVEGFEEDDSRMTIVDTTITGSGLRGLAIVTGCCGNDAVGPVVELVDSLVARNRGGVSVGGAASLDIRNSTIEDNDPPVGFIPEDTWGGGIANFGGTVTMSDSRVVGNTSGVGEPLDARGGGLFNGSNPFEGEPGTATITRSVFEGNMVFQGEGEGAGIYNEEGSVLSMSDVQVTGNMGFFFGGGLFNAGVADVTGSTFAGNTGAHTGGGIANFGVLELTGSDLVDNVTSDGGGDGGGAGLFNFGSATVIDTNVARNLSDEDNGAVFNRGHLDMTGGSITDNESERGGGVSNNYGGFDPDVVATLTGVTIRDNGRDSEGSGISNFGTFIGDDLTVDGNNVANFGDLTLTGSTVANTPFGDAGVIAEDGITRIVDTMIHGNMGVGLGAGGRDPGGDELPLPAVVEITGSEIFDNAGGVIISSGEMTITDSIIRDNTTSGGVIIFDGELTMTDSIVRDNTTSSRGAGMDLWPGVSVTLTGVDVFGNAANTGGGLYVDVGADLVGSGLNVHSNASDPGAGRWPVRDRWDRGPG